MNKKDKKKKNREKSNKKMRNIIKNSFSDRDKWNLTISNYSVKDLEDGGNIVFRKVFRNPNAWEEVSKEDLEHLGIVYE